MKLDILSKFPERAATAQIEERIERVNVVKGHVNKIMFVLPKAALQYNGVRRCTLSVKHISDRIENLVTSVNFGAFVDISDEKNGAVVGISPELASVQRDYAAGTDEILKNALDCASNDDVAVIVDLGSFELINGDELEINFTRYAYANKVMPALEIYSVSDQPNEPFHFISYDVDYDQNELHRNVKELYLIDGEQWNGTSFDVYVDSLSAQYQCTNFGARAYAMLAGKYESQNPEMFKIYDSLIPEDVAVKIIGRNAGIVGVLCVRVESNVDAYQSQQKNALNRQSAILENFEKNQPETAAVLQAAGTPSSSAVALKALDL